MQRLNNPPPLSTKVSRGLLLQNSAPLYHKAACKNFRNHKQKSLKNVKILIISKKFKTLKFGFKRSTMKTELQKTTRFDLKVRTLYFIAKWNSTISIFFKFIKVLKCSEFRNFWLIQQLIWKKNRSRVWNHKYASSQQKITTYFSKKRKTLGTKRYPKFEKSKWQLIFGINISHKPSRLPPDKRCNYTQ